MLITKNNCMINIIAASQFDDWMQKIGNKYYNDNRLMFLAYKRVEPIKTDIN